MNLTQNLEYKGITYKITGDPDEIRIQCPFCFEDNFKCYLNEGKNLYHCFRCEQSGKLSKVFKLIKEDENINFFSKLKKSEIKKININDFLEDTIPWYEILGDRESLIIKKYRDYLYSRKITNKDIKEFDVRAGRIRKYSGHTIFPILDKEGNLKYYQTRKAFGTGMKSLNPPVKFGVKKSDNIFNIQNAKDGQIAVICEGIFDALWVRKMEQIVDMPLEAFAILGHEVSERQLEILRHYAFSHVIVMFDPDVPYPAYKTALRFTKFWDNVGVAEIKADPDELSHEYLALKIVGAMSSDLRKLTKRMFEVVIK